ncbi:MAG: class I SAM-dependent methyltransferase [Acidobacteria bacterium]|jgi:2-polyprenyl-3-methyl-5-hydroxy-6-metoxy-1,4-benzoquinol methylase|nr:class I SAM-dependent methyltransferase [Acidobacteriota bacterium]MBA3785057.1 class I SAM-dependent methyltransferase [Acidobacteriota bacterium]MBA4122674.1 class I SAM-dependent methyltransferase [Acidobacteriota bacterium]
MTGFSDVEIQSVRDYWNRRPCNIRHSTAEIGTKEYFDQVEARKYLVEPHIPAFAGFANWKGKKVLEIGCGIGTDTINFARAGAEVTAVDLSSKSLKLAARRAEVFGFSDRINFYEANAEKLSEYIPAQKYDLVYSFGVIHHSPHPEKIIGQIRDYFIHPGSTLKLMVYYRYSWKVFWMLIQEKGRFWKLDKIIARHSEAQTGCPVTYSYTRKTIKDLIGENFDIEENYVEHIFPYRIPEYVKYEYVKEWYWRMLPENVFLRLEKTFGWHLCVTAKAK